MRFLRRCLGVVIGAALFARRVHFSGFVHEEIFVLFSFGRDLLDFTEDSPLTLEFDHDLAMKVLNVEILSRHIRRAEHMLDVSAMSGRLRTITLVGNYVLAQGRRGELVLLIRVHDNGAVLLCVISTRHGSCSSAILRMIHGGCHGRHTAGSCLQR